MYIFWSNVRDRSKRVLIFFPASYKTSLQYVDYISFRVQLSLSLLIAAEASFPSKKQNIFDLKSIHEYFHHIHVYVT